TTIATGVGPQVDLLVGVHTLTLTVTDDGDATGTDQVVITVEAGSATLTVLGTGTGSGTVASSPAGISCTITDGTASGDCAQAYTQNTQVTLTATPSAVGVHQFQSWSGAGIDCPGTGPCTLTMDANQTVTAEFIEFHSLTVQGAGTGDGTVAGGGGIDCSISSGQTQGNCSVFFTEGVNVDLTASASPGSTFDGWSGACTGTGGCQVTMSQARTVTASFSAATAVLTVLIDGIGVVNSQGVTPAINCSYIEGMCSETYPIGTQVTLVATSQHPDFSWESWFGTGSGFTCTTDPTCVVTMDQDRQVRAWFSVPGFISVDPTTAAFTMSQGGTPTPGSATITVSNIGDRPVNLSPIQISYSPDVAPWLRATIDKTVIDTLSPGTMTLSVLSNNLDPGVYNASVFVGDFVVTAGQVNVTLTVLPSGPPVLSGIDYALLGINDAQSCDIFPGSPPGSLFQVAFDYADGDGDVAKVDSVLTVFYLFQPSQGSGSFDATPFSSWSGDGFTGSIDTYQCYLFAGNSSVDVTITLEDLAGNVSNGITVNVPAPSGANAPPAGGSTASVTPQAGPGRLARPQ
ncbi:MAG: hypothetical protein OEO20_13630, partial [Gemmatimonadota bacterium]|nr:hypothetical protein [Gemmatimonadota bacterium]